VAEPTASDGVKSNRPPVSSRRFEAAIKAGKPCVIDVHMQNVPTPTAGHWNIMDIYRPAKKSPHVAHRLNPKLTNRIAIALRRNPRSRPNPGGP